MEKGLFALVLHAHLPFVRHPEHDYFLEEHWFYEALTETYLPLIEVFQGLERGGVRFRLTLSLTPTLLGMLREPLLQERYLSYLGSRIQLSQKEMERTQNEPHFYEMARHYHERFLKARAIFCDEFGCDLSTAFKGFQDRGFLEIITCAATHSFLPLTSRTLEIVRGQIFTACDDYERIMGRRPIGIWLAECGYYPGVDQVLKEAGIRYFFTDTHGILHASPRPKFGVFAPIYCPTGVAAFGRDLESSKQVWSALEGYPGDPDYREFYRDIGYDLDFEYIRPYISPDGIRVNTGIKYYRITHNGNHKEPYNRRNAIEKAALHAGNFLFNRQRQAEFLHDFLGRKPIIVAPYDAELYGHWWYEGPEFLDFFIRKLAFDQDVLGLVTPSDYLKEMPVNQVSTPSLSSWGWKGYCETWLSGANHWIYRHLHKATLRMNELIARFKDSNGFFIERALNQAARELFLAQSSDWAFIMQSGTMVPYAVKRTKEHLFNFLKIYEGLLHNRLEENVLKELEERNGLFPHVDVRSWIK